MQSLPGFRDVSLIPSILVHAAPTCGPLHREGLSLLHYIFLSLLTSFVNASISIFDFVSEIALS